MRLQAFSFSKKGSEKMCPGRVAWTRQKELCDNLFFNMSPDRGAHIPRNKTLKVGVLKIRAPSRAKQNPIWVDHSDGGKKPLWPLWWQLEPELNGSIVWLRPRSSQQGRWRFTNAGVARGMQISFQRVGAQEVTCILQGSHSPEMHDTWNYLI